MGREVRKVPGNWVHPKDSAGEYIPMHERFTFNREEIKEGLRDGWLENTPPYYGVPVMPQWPASERTHLMMYESTSEGTPISPAFATAEELARWLADNEASAFGGSTASYESWLRVAKGGYAPSMIIDSQGIHSGVSFLK